MKKKIKFFICLLCIVVGISLFSACGFSFGGSDGGVDENVANIPSEVKVEGFKSEIVVGDGYYSSSLKVQQKLNGEWQEVVKADYAVSCDYDGTKYGDYTITLYLVNYPHVKATSTLIVKPLTVKLPTYSTVYTGENIDIKAQIEQNSEGLYEVTKYTKESNVGTYSASITLSNPNKYCWVDDSGNVLRGNTKSIDWTITKAQAKEYTGLSDLTVYYGDTLYDVAVQNNLKNITWVDAETTLVTNQQQVFAIYNESPGNYDDTSITINFVEIISESNYSIEIYFFDGTDYVIDNMLSSYDNVGEITEIINITPQNFEGYILNSYLSELTGKVEKNNGLTLRLYYDLSE